MPSLLAEDAALLVGSMVSAHPGVRSPYSPTWSTGLRHRGGREAAEQRNLCRFAPRIGDCGTRTASAS